MTQNGHVTIIVNHFELSAAFLCLAVISSQHSGVSGSGGSTKTRSIDVEGRELGNFEHPMCERPCRHLSKA